jgi:TRAP-type C4-dicarboxylate transport system permease small subunit
MTAAEPEFVQEAPGLLGTSSPLMRAAVRVLDVSAKVICVAMLTVLFVGLFANVVLRYVFGTGLDWAYDIHQILFPWMIAAGAVLATIHCRHVTITLLIENAPLKVAKTAYVLSCILVACISASVIWSSIPIMKAAQYQRIMALGGVSQLWGYLSITYAFAAIAVLSVIDAMATATGHRNPVSDGATNSLS